VQVATNTGAETFDQVVFACHSDQTLALLADPSPTEQQVLGALRYQPNEVVLHTDPMVLPRNRSAWAAWNALVPRSPNDSCTVSYCMNLLQGIDSPTPVIVTLNPLRPIHPRFTLRRLYYRHPIYSHASVAAQGRKAEIQGRHRTWYAGAYWGWGFHEDGMRSAVEVAATLDAPWSLEFAGGKPARTPDLAA
jgi:uncharacterized protein